MKNGLGKIQNRSGMNPYFSKQVDDTVLMPSQKKYLASLISGNEEEFKAFDYKTVVENLKYDLIKQYFSRLKYSCCITYYPYDAVAQHFHVFFLVRLPRCKTCHCKHSSHRDKLSAHVDFCKGSNTPAG